MFRTAALAAAFLALAAALLVGLSREGRRRSEAGRGAAAAGGRTERCVSCHVRPEEDPGGAHARAALGCASCHLGNPLAFSKERAHLGMEREPGALETVGRTCGRAGCHPREATRVESSLMSRAAGIVAVDRWAFGETPAPDGDESMPAPAPGRGPAAGGSTPARDHLRRLCAGCHLRTRRDNRDDAVRGTGSGCSACHVAPRSELRGAASKRPHPPVDARVPDDRCLGCHSRSGRISLSYRGLAEIEPHQREGDPRPCPATGTGAGGGTAPSVPLHDGRPACALPSDVHAAAGMACTDCHLHTELMGDGTRPRHEEEAVEISCEACHGPATAASGGESTWRSVRDPVSLSLLRMRGETRPPGDPVRLGKRGTPLRNLLPDGRGGWLLAVAGGRRLAVRQTPADADHALKGHERLSCSACHTAWAPLCGSCHTSYEPAGAQWDFGAGAVRPGAWKESSSGFSWGPPALAVRSGTIVPAAPGMVATLDATPLAPGGARTVRLYAAVEPHTTGKKARSCSSCHREPCALGLGTGTLELLAAGPRFTPRERAAEREGLAADGWVGLFPPRAAGSTRTTVSSLDAAAQRRLLAAGACVPCHGRAGDPVWRDFGRAAARLRAGGAACVFPRASWPLS